VTTIAFKDGWIAADSRVTVDSEGGGARKFKCEKLYRKIVGEGDQRREVIIGTSGESSPSLLFVDWYGSGEAVPDQLIYGSADFTCLIVESDGIYEADAYCRPEKIVEPFYAIGSGSKAALAAMHCGKSAAEAVEIACRIDPYSAPPIVVMRLNDSGDA
jgi:hypothetical protein